MKTKFWIIIILTSITVVVTAVYYANQPTPDLGPVVEHHVVNKLVAAPKAPGQTQIDDRTLLTPDNKKIYNKSDTTSCDENFNSDKPSQNVEYKNTSKSFSVLIPYNPNWGSSRFRLNAYDVVDDNVYFGVMGVFEGCSWVRQYVLSFLALKPVPRIMQEIDSISGPGNSSTSTLKQIGQLQTVQYQEYGLCDTPVIIVIGESYNYQLRPLCGGDFRELEKIAQTIKLEN